MRHKPAHHEQKGPVDTMKALLAILLMFALMTPVYAEQVEFRYSLDTFSKKNTPLEGLQSITVLREIGPGLHFGQSLYSASAGDAGGLFVGGFELLKRWHINDRTSLEFGGFIGGGGGAAVVPGDGLMARTHLTLKRRLFGGVAGLVGLSYIDISGSGVSTPTLSFGISRDVDFAFAPGHDAQPSQGRVVRAVKPIIKQFHPQGSLQRSGAPLGTMTLIGFEASFAASPNARSETFIQATGAVAGDGEGYADIQAGYRWRTSTDGISAFAEVAAGFGGGGDVDTGGGFIATVGGGITVPLFTGFEAEIGAQATTALDGDFTAISPFIRASLSFGDPVRPYGQARNWQLSLGISQQQPNDEFRKPGVSATAAPVLAESSLDLFLSDRFYFTGNAQTVMAGDAGGYAVGLLGLGYTIPLNDHWSISAEGHLGAAGGGGVDTGGGLVGAGRVELDYWLSDQTALSAGIGLMRSLRGGGASPTTFHLSFKSRFSTFH